MCIFLKLLVMAVECSCLAVHTVSAALAVSTAPPCSCARSVPNQLGLVGSGSAAPALMRFQGTLSGVHCSCGHGRIALFGKCKLSIAARPGIAAMFSYRGNYWLKTVTNETVVIHNVVQARRSLKIQQVKTSVQLLPLPYMFAMQTFCLAWTGC
jgi:hypothetical protein